MRYQIRNQADEVLGTARGNDLEAAKRDVASQALEVFDVVPPLDEEGEGIIYATPSTRGNEFKKGTG